MEMWAAHATSATPQQILGGLTELILNSDQQFRFAEYRAIDYVQAEEHETTVETGIRLFKVQKLSHLLNGLDVDILAPLSTEI
eukprot:scaffold7895_cov210-Ochromonas_danica.AAC.2